MDDFLRSGAEHTEASLGLIPAPARISGHASKHQEAAWFVQQRLLEGVETFAALEERIGQLATDQEKGAAFEVFAEAYFATQPIQQAAEVWPLPSLPPRIRRRAGLERRDFGVDGVVQTIAGQFNAYQVKFRSGRAQLSWSDLSTFMGLTDQVAQRVLFTNSNGLSFVMDKRQRFYPIRGADLDRLEPTDFAVMRAWLDSVIVRRECRTPLPHQEKALAALLPALAKNGARATTVMACGSGKTLVGFWAAFFQSASLSPWSVAAASRALASSWLASAPALAEPLPSGCT